MNKRSLGALIALNVALVVALVATILSPQPAQAQGLGGANFIMVSGEASLVNGGQEVVYVIETNSGRILPIIYNGSTNQWTTPYPVHDLANDISSFGRSR